MRTRSLIFLLGSLLGLGVGCASEPDALHGADGRGLDGPEAAQASFLSDSGPDAGGATVSAPSGSGFPADACCTTPECPILPSPADAGACGCDVKSDSFVQQPLACGCATGQCPSSLQAYRDELCVRGSAAQANIVAEKGCGKLEIAPTPYSGSYTFDIATGALVGRYAFKDDGSFGPCCASAYVFGEGLFPQGVPPAALPGSGCAQLARCTLCGAGDASIPPCL